MLSSQFLLRTHSLSGELSKVLDQLPQSLWAEMGCLGEWVPESGHGQFENSNHCVMLKELNSITTCPLMVINIIIILHITTLIF